jgi:hypothetical protein
MNKDLYKKCLNDYEYLNKGYVNSDDENNKIKYFIDDGKVIGYKKDYFDRIIPKNCIQNNINYIVIGHIFNTPLEKGDIPNDVTHLTFADLYNQPLKKGVIPNSVTHLKFGNNFNQPLKKGVIPNSVTHLEFGFCFNQPLNNKNLPIYLIELISFNPTYNTKLLNINNILFGNLLFSNLLIHPNDDFLIKYDYGNIDIGLNDKNKLNEYIDNNLTKDKLIGSIIFQELLEKVYEPKRLLKICNDYDIDLSILINIY